MEKIEQEQKNVFKQPFEHNSQMDDHAPNIPETAQKIDPDAPLTQEQALSVLIQAAKIAQKAGVYTLDDAEIINKSIRVFLKKN